MNNLPISSNGPQPSGNAANALQAGIATDGPAIDARLTEPFAFLLAQQISEAGLPAPETAQAAIAIDGNAKDGGTDPALKDAQDPTVTASTPSDPATMMAAILMQLSTPENKGQRAEGMQATRPLTLGPSQKTEGMQITQPLAADPSLKTEGIQTTQPLTLASAQEAERKISMIGSENSQMSRLQATSLNSSEATSNTESPSGQTQPTANTAQTVVPQAATAAMPETTSAAGTTPTISTPLSNKGWAEEFSQKIRWIATQQNQIAELHLNPPDLGPLDVVLKISDNQATALFASPHGAVRDAVENALPKLREILADNGIMLGNTTISDQSPRDRNMNEFMNQGFGTAAQHVTSVTAPEPAESSPAVAQTVPVRRHNGMVDTFA